ncbi:MAG: Rrf2 family transcriptional regulator [Rhodothermales bacterium]|nr:Rrf2 family transcriptional regulator [Rhodothermales bacterium]
MVNTRFSTSLHILTALAGTPDDERHVVPSAELASRVGSHPAAVRRLLAELKAAELVDVVRGPGGGFRLAVDPGLIRLDRLAEAVGEGPAFSIHDPGVSDTVETDFHVPAAIHSVNAAVTDRMRTALSDFTLADVVEQASLRRDLAKLVASGLSDEEIRAAYRISGGRLVRRDER